MYYRDKMDPDCLGKRQTYLSFKEINQEIRNGLVLEHILGLQGSILGREGTAHLGVVVELRVLSTAAPSKLKVVRFLFM